MEYKLKKVKVNLYISNAFSKSKNVFFYKPDVQVFLTNEIGVEHEQLNHKENQILEYWSLEGADDDDDDDEFVDSKRGVKHEPGVNILQNISHNGREKFRDFNIV